MNAQGVLVRYWLEHPGDPSPPHLALTQSGGPVPHEEDFFNLHDRSDTSNVVECSVGPVTWTTQGFLTSDGKDVRREDIAVVVDVALTATKRAPAITPPDEVDLALWIRDMHRRPDSSHAEFCGQAKALADLVLKRNQPRAGEKVLCKHCRLQPNEHKGLAHRPEWIRGDA